MPQSSLELYTSIVPSPRQTAFQEDGFHVFFHYGINTFTNKEWGDGKAPAQLFNPTRQSTDQWMEAVSASGAKGVILTSKASRRLLPLANGNNGILCAQQPVPRGARRRSARG